jgi:hypothetical protein
MSDTNSTPAPETTAATKPEKVKRKKPQPKPRGAIVKTEAELKAQAKPAANYRGYRVSILGETRYFYCPGHWEAAAWVLKELGGTITTLGRARTPDQIEADVLAMTPEQRAALLAKLGGTLTPATEKPTEKAKAKK